MKIECDPTDLLLHIEAMGMDFPPEKRTLYIKLSELLAAGHNFELELSPEMLEVLTQAQEELRLSGQDYDLGRPTRVGKKCGVGICK